MKKILVLTDFSAAARSAAGLGLVLAGQSGARLVVVNAWTPPLLIEVPDTAAYPLEAERAAGQAPHQQLHTEALRLYQLQQKLQPVQPAVIETISYRGSLAQAIEANLTGMDPDLILIGHDSAERGQVIRSKLTALNYPLLVVPTGFSPNGPLKTIAFATDLHPGDAWVLIKLKKLSATLQTRLMIYHVSEPTFNMAAEEEQKIAAFMKAMAHNGIPWSAYDQCYGEAVAREIELYAEKKQAGLLALVHRQHGWLWRAGHQSQEAGILAYDRLPILLMPEQG